MKFHPKNCFRRCKLCKTIWFFPLLFSVTFSFLLRPHSSSIPVWNSCWLLCCPRSWPIKTLSQEKHCNFFQELELQSLEKLSFIRKYALITLNMLFNFFYKFSNTFCPSFTTGLCYTSLLLMNIKGSTIRLHANMLLEFLLGKAFISVICSTYAL